MTCGWPAITPWTRCGWRRPIGTGATTSPRTTPPLETGLGFAVAWNKPDGFIGRAALDRQRAGGLTRRLVQFAVDDPDVVLLHNEPIPRRGRIVGETTSAAYGHTPGKDLAFGYVANPDGIADNAYLTEATYQIDVGGTPSRRASRSGRSTTRARLGSRPDHPAVDRHDRARMVTTAIRLLHVARELGPTRRRAAPRSGRVSPRGRWWAAVCSGQRDRRRCPQWTSIG